MRPFLQRENHSSLPALRTPMDPAAAPPALARLRGGPSTTGHGSPHVEVIKEGDKVVRLVVTCSCGERVEIDCLYPAGA